MKFILILTCLALFVANTQAQWCKGLPIVQNCRGGSNSGSDGDNCEIFANPNMWYYDIKTRNCLTMSYLGCKGNSNRYCTKTQCELRCKI